MDVALIRKHVEDIKEKIRNKSSEETRTTGNPHKSNLERELSNSGRKRKPDDIPKQDTIDRRGNTQQGNVSHSFQSSTVTTNKKYRMGPAMRPNITHDQGFSIFPKRKPTLSEYWELLKWTGMLEGGYALRPDLIDGLSAYAHFLHGKGESREFSYERYVSNDESGRTTLRNAILDAQDAAIKLWKDNNEPEKFHFTGPAIPCGSNETDPKYNYIKKAFPYPATENWQKTIGAHVIWLNGEVVVKKSSTSPNETEFKMELTLNAEDQYNFNPGMKDYATGIPDDDNGIFVIVGFAHGYRNTATLKRRFYWKGFDLGVAKMGIQLQRLHSPPEVQHRESR